MKIKTLQDILVIEDDLEILSYRCPDTGYLLWPLIRNTFIRFIKSDLHYKEPLISVQKSSHPLRAYTTILQACVHNIMQGCNLQGDILISSTGHHVIKDGLHFNRLSDHFALAVPNRTCTMESLPADWHLPFPRKNEKILFDSPILGLSFFCNKFCVRDRHVTSASALVTFMAAQAQSLLGWSLSEEREKFLVTYLAKKIASIPGSRFFYSRLFKKTGAKILLREEGSYGSSSIINKVARENGLITAEYQHGSISSGHDAYNFSKTLCDSLDYRHTLPQFLLGYGTWWLSQITTPSTKVPIGNPYRIEIIKKIRVNARHKKDILVLGDGIETEKYIELCFALAKEVGKKFRIVFRPHPLERDRVHHRYGKKRNEFFIEWKNDIYEAFNLADVLISELSTGLFEAIGLVRAIFLWDTEKAKFCFPSHPFSTFKSSKDLIEKLKSENEGMVSESIIESVWATNWRENYRTFLKNALP